MRQNPLQQRTSSIKASQTCAHYFGFVVKRETTIGFVAIPCASYAAMRAH